MKKESGNKKKILENVFWALFGKIVTMLGSLFVGILVARYLGPANYGLMNYVISYVSLFSVIASFGLSNIEVRELSKNPAEYKTIVGTCFGLRVLFSLIAYLLLVFSLVFYRVDSFTTLMILIYGISLFTTCDFEIIRNYFTSIMKNEYIVKSEISRTVIGAVVKIILLYSKAPLWCFIVAVLFDTILVASGYMIAFHKFATRITNWKFSKAVALYMTRQSFPLLLSGAAIIVYQKIDQIMIGNMINKESVGYFATAEKFLNIILFLPSVLSQTVTPLIVKAKNEFSNEDYKKKAFQFISITTWTSIVITTICSICAYWLIYLTYGIQYIAAVPVLQIMAWKTVWMAISSSGGQLIIIEGLQKWAVFRNLAGCFACVGLNLILIPKYGIIGSATVSVITIFCSGFLANFIIPPYRHIFILECKALLLGWKELKYLKSFIKR